MKFRLYSTAFEMVLFWENYPQKDGIRLILLELIFFSLFVTNFYCKTIFSLKERRQVGVITYPAIDVFLTLADFMSTEVIEFVHFSYRYSFLNILSCNDALRKILKNIKRIYNVYP